MNNTKTFYLVLKILRDADSIVMKFMQMDEKLRVGELGHNFEASNGYKVRSWQFPEINDHAVYIPGSNKSMDWVYFVGYPHLMSVEALVEKTIVALKEYLESVFGEMFQFYYDGDTVKFITLDEHMQTRITRE